MNDRTREITGRIHVEAQLVDSASAQFFFFVPKEWAINSLQDRNNDSYDDDRTTSVAGNVDLIRLDLSDEKQPNDTLFLNIEFKTILDSSSFGNIFLNQKEFLLPYNSLHSWLPLFGSLTTECFSLELTVPQQFTVVSEQPFDTVSTDGSRIWKRSASQRTLLSTAFTLCGLQNPMKQKAFSSDSLFSVTLFSSPFRFNQQYAAAISSQLSDAIRYFTAMTKQTRVKSMTYAVVGNGKIEKPVFSSRDFIILRNSPAYTVFDSASITRTAFNHWLLRLSRRFCPASNDSTAVFDDGFASYLALRFLRSSYPSFTKQEQFQSLSNALTFFPVGTIAAGHTSKANTNEIISFKGRNLFLMLEHLLGSESFSAVIETVSARYSETHITFNEFQSLCEAEYGSSLEWFFNQWLYRSTVPEYVMQWKSETTLRGMSIIRTTIEQRGDLFSMPVPIVFTFGNRKVTKRVFVEQAKQEFTFTFPQVPVSVELDPQYTILRWLLNIRISAHAKTSLQFLSINRDVVNAEREALYTLQLDPNNSTGSAPLAYYVLGNISAAAAGNSEKAKENFLKAASSFATEETDLYRLLSSLRYANLLENDGKREEAIALYQRAVTEGLKSPLILERAIIEAENFIHEKFMPNNDLWFDIH
jgi:tetratricopeptide (TPR) repeat protein